MPHFTFSGTPSLHDSQRSLRMANEKRKSRGSDDEEIDKQKVKKTSMDSNNYDFFHDKPE